MQYVGVDQHKHFSQIAVLNGQEVSQHKLYHKDKQQIREFFESFDDEISVTMEATGNWYWLYDILEELQIKVKMAHPLKVKAIADARIKTDKIDARILAMLDKADLVPCSYIAPVEVRCQRQYLRYRQSLVALCSSLKCKIHAVLNHQGITTPACTDLFGKKGLAYLKELKLSDPYQQSLNGYLELFEHFHRLVKEITNQLKTQLKEDPRAELLISVPGIGTTLAYLLLAEIGDIQRFSNQDKLCSYAGLVPSTYQTGQTCYHGRITRQGNKYIRWAMTEAAQIAAIRDPALRAFYFKLSKAKGNSKAKVAVARKLLTAVYQILKKNEPYKTNSLTRINLGKPALGTGH